MGHGQIHGFSLRHWNCDLYLASPTNWKAASRFGQRFCSNREGANTASCRGLLSTRGLGEHVTKESTNLGLIFFGHRVSFNPMLKMLLIGFLSLLLLCMVPLMGSTLNSGGHLHHDSSTSCATCMGSVDLPLAIFLLTFLSWAIFMPLLSPAFVASRSPFHPPRLNR